jgi:hypothetical protein
MKKLLIGVMLFMLASPLVAQVVTLTPEQNAIKLLIKNMYAIDPDTFEYAEFGGKYKNGEVVVKGKYDPDRQCRLLADFLVKEAIIKNKRAKQGCKSGFRYPSVDDMELSSATRIEPLPKPRINTPLVDGDKAKVHVEIPNAGDVFYYLRKMPEGWRIYRVESRENSGNPDHIEKGDMVHVIPPEAPYY